MIYTHVLNKPGLAVRSPLDMPGSARRGKPHSELDENFSIILVRCMGARVVAFVLFAAALSSCERAQRLWLEEPWKWSASGVAETRRRGDAICHAIDAYRAKAGKYPSRLEDLQPAFIREIPQPTVGYKKWAYMLIDQGTNYWLHVVASEFGPQLDKNVGEHWQYMDDHGQRDI